jgi:guanosine-3',5'-bis(diphosphate) 3'-pyrophosphohydrolase
VVTGRARAPDPRRSAQEQRDKSHKLGQELLEKEMQQRSLSMPRLLKHQDELRKVLEKFGAGSADELFIAIGYGKLPAKAITDFLSPKDGERESEPPANLREGRLESLVRRVTGRTSHGIVLNGVDDVLVRYTKCCNPLPGDEIVGFITRGRGVTVHRRNCTKAFDTDPDRRVEIQWDARAKINRPVQVRVTTANRPGILATVGQTFHAQGINISEATCRAGDDGRASNTFTFLCSDLAQLKGVIKQLQKIPGVMNVERA